MSPFLNAIGFVQVPEATKWPFFNWILYVINSFNSHFRALSGLPSTCFPLPISLYLSLTLIKTSWSAKFLFFQLSDNLGPKINWLAQALSAIRSASPALRKSLNLDAGSSIPEYNPSIIDKVSLFFWILLMRC